MHATLDPLILPLMDEAVRRQVNIHSGRGRFKLSQRECKCDAVAALLQVLFDGALSRGDTSEAEALMKDRSDRQVTGKE